VGSCWDGLVDFILDLSDAGVSVFKEREMTYQEPVYRFRVYRVWNIPSRPDLHGRKDLVYSARDIGNAEEHRMWCADFFGRTGDTFLVEDHGFDTVIEREVY
jgi:hypothetical protein